MQGHSEMQQFLQNQLTFFLKEIIYPHKNNYYFTGALYLEVKDYYLKQIRWEQKQLKARSSVKYVYSIRVAYSYFLFSFLNFDN